MNIFLGFILSLTPLGVAAIIGVATFAALPNAVGVAIGIILVILAIWLGVIIFKKIQIIGVLEFITAVHASPDLDNLKQVQESDTKRRSPKELVHLINEKNSKFKGGTIRIYEDWFGKPYDNYHEIEYAKFDKSTHILSLHFTNCESLEIYNPRIIFEASTFLKIVKADRIKLSWLRSTEDKSAVNLYFLDYKLNARGIETSTNVDYYTPIFDVSLGAPALMIFG